LTQRYLALVWILYLKLVFKFGDLYCSAEVWGLGIWII